MNNQDREGTPDPRNEDIFRVYQHVQINKDIDNNEDVIHVSNHHIEMVCETKRDIDSFSFLSSSFDIPQS